MAIFILLFHFPCGLYLPHLEQSPLWAFPWFPVLFSSCFFIKQESVVDHVFTALAGSNRNYLKTQSEKEKSYLREKWGPAWEAGRTRNKSWEQSEPGKLSLARGCDSGRAWEPCVAISQEKQTASPSNLTEMIPNRSLKICKELGSKTAQRERANLSISRERP